MRGRRRGRGEEREREGKGGEEGKERGRVEEKRDIQAGRGGVV